MPSAPIPPVEEKSKADRLKETIHLLKQLKGLGYSEIDAGYKEVQAHLTQWVADGERLNTTVDFARHNRIAELSLPKVASRAASINLKVVA